MSLVVRIKAAKEANECRIVVYAMREGATNASVAEIGCWALLSLACTNADNQKRIAEAGGIAITLSMMKEHGASNAGVAEDGCLALRNLADNNAYNKMRIGVADGIAMILSMMETHGESSSVVAEQGCAALWNLIADVPNVEIIGVSSNNRINAENKRKILAANGVSMVERMKSIWASNADVQTNANGALAILRN